MVSKQANKSAEGWMGKLRIVTTECNHKEINRQLKEQFLHWLIDSDMWMEIIKEILKIEENNNVRSEQVLAWARRVETQKGTTNHPRTLKQNKRF